MSQWLLSQVSAPLNAELIGKDVSFEFVSTDTRTIKSGELFIALKGPNFNGHEFIAAAKNAGACAALVSEKISTDLPLLFVQDTHKALGQLAALRREQLPSIPLIALTGSCGKTTVKEMLRSILSVCGPTLANEGTLNNDIGGPLTLLKLTEEHRFAVIEMGANHAGEIAYLTNMAKPNVAFINNIAPAHLEGFGSVEGVAKAKSEIFQGLQSDGIALINNDDHYADWIRQRVTAKNYTFGVKNSADYMAHDLQREEEGGYSFILQTPDGKIAIKSHLLGKHNVINAVVAAAAAHRVGADFGAIKSGLEMVQPVNGRLATKQGKNGSKIFDDSYNANPSSVRAGLEVLSQFPNTKIFVMGDMGELGANTENFHFEIGQLAKQLGINSLYAYGSLSKAAVKGFGVGAIHFDNQDELSNAVVPLLKTDTIVLVKGSKSMKMGNIVAKLVEQ